MTVLRAAILFLTAFFVSAAAANAAPPVSTGRLSSLAAGGYEVVAYFNDGAPAKGVAEFSTEYSGATWRFATADNLAAFKADPAAYAPQYGGYCAWAISQGYTAPGSPKHWTIRNGKLYLNYNAKVQKDWLADPDGFIVKADANWPGVLSR